MPKSASNVMEVDCRNMNCYNCRGFRHLVRNCKNKGTKGRIRKGRRLEYGDRNNGQSNLNRKGNLIVFN